MPWYYDQLSGKIFHNDIFVGVGYSGAGRDADSGRNNPDLEGVRSTGPVPTGEYAIGPAYHHPTKGALCMRLTPIGHDALGRSGFLIHGNNAQNDASQGCIIADRTIRNRIALSGDTRLVVE